MRKKEVKYSTGHQVQGPVESFTVASRLSFCALRLNPPKRKLQGVAVFRVERCLEGSAKRVITADSTLPLRS